MPGRLLEQNTVIYSQICVKIRLDLKTRAQELGLSLTDITVRGFETAIRDKEDEIRRGVGFHPPRDPNHLDVLGRSNPWCKSRQENPDNVEKTPEDKKND